MTEENFGNELDQTNGSNLGIFSGLENGEPTVVVAVLALIDSVSPDYKETKFHTFASRFRELWLSLHTDPETGVSSISVQFSDEDVRSYLASSVLPLLESDGYISLPNGQSSAPDSIIVLSEKASSQIVSSPEHTRYTISELASRMIGRVLVSEPTASIVEGGSILSAEGLVKSYRGRSVVNDVAISLQQGEIVGLLGPNGAGKTTTFYMIVGLISPLAGKIKLDGEDITKMPMYKRARMGIGYLSQEPSIFRKLTVEDNILAILETLDIDSKERYKRLENLLDELKIKHLRKSKAYQLSGGERRRLEITRALVTEPRFMMLDEPFAGVDPIAVDDIQKIVAQLRYRGIGVLISDHNVEQTLDIVDRAYIMYDGEVKYSGTVRDLVFDDSVSRIYLGPTLTSRLRKRFADSTGELAG